MNVTTDNAPKSTRDRSQDHTDIEGELVVVVVTCFMVCYNAHEICVFAHIVAFLQKQFGILLLQRDEWLDKLDQYLQPYKNIDSEVPAIIWYESTRRPGDVECFGFIVNPG